MLGTGSRVVQIRRNGQGYLNVAQPDNLLLDPLDRHRKGWNQLSATEIVKEVKEVKKGPADSQDRRRP